MSHLIKIYPVCKFSSFRLVSLRVKNAYFFRTRTVVQGQLAEPAICFRDLYACEELIQTTSCLDKKLIFNIYESKISIHDIYTSQ